MALADCALALNAAARQGTSSEVHMAEDLKARAVPLTEDDAKKIDELLH